mgnify:CR=1 FL=1
MSEEQVAEVSEVAEVAPSVAVSDDWRSVLDEDIRDHKSLSTIKSVAQLGKSFVNQNWMVGADKLAVPGKYATDEDWKIVDSKLGRPETPEGYKLENNLAEGMTDSPEMLEGFQSAAHNVGLRPAQAQGLLDWYNEQMGGQIEADTGQGEQLRADAELELKREYGPAYDDRMGNARAVVSEFGNDGLADIQLADGRPLGDHPEMIKMMVNVSEFINSRISEDTLEGMKHSGAMTPADINAKIQETMGEVGKTPFWIARHPQHDAAKAEVNRLTHMLTGEAL